MTSNATPQMPSILFSAHGDQLLLENLASAWELRLLALMASPLIFSNTACASKIAPILQMLFMQSLNTGTLPEDWLTANITPLYKKGSRSIPSNYRTISLTPVYSKVMEHIVFHSIMQHVQLYGILQYSSRLSWYSCAGTCVCSIFVEQLSPNSCVTRELTFV